MIAFTKIISSIQNINRLYYMQPKPTLIQKRSVKMDLLFREAVNEFTNLEQLPHLHLKYEAEYKHLDKPTTLSFPWLQVMLRGILLLQVMLYPYTLKLLFSNLSNPDNLYWCIPLVCVLGFLRVFLRTQVIWLQFQLEASIRKILCKKIVYHSIYSDIQNKTNTWNLINNDSHEAIGYFQSKQQLYFQTIKLVLGVVFLYRTFNTAIFYGIGIVIILTSIISFASRKIVSLTDKLSFIRDRKFSIVSFMLDRIRQIKMCRLQNYFFSKIKEVRDQQFNNLKQRKLWDTLCVAAWQLTHILLSFSVFAIFLTFYSEGTKFQIQSVLYVLEMLIMPLNGLPWYLSGLKKANKAMERINNFLNTNPKTEYKHIINNRQLEPSLVITKQGNLPIVDINVREFSLTAGNLYCLQGPTGSGKSLFLKSLLGMLPSSYSCTINGKIGYVDEHLFHLQKSMDSVHSTLSIRPQLYDKQINDLLLKFHCLEIPLDNLTSTYSGGERLRLSLVRAFYKNDVIFIDSDLNSLDKRVRTYIQSQLLLLAKQMKKIVVIATNNPISENIIQITKNQIFLTQQKSPLIFDYSSHQTYIDSYFKNHQIQIKSLFQQQEKHPPLISQKLYLKHFLFYYKNIKKHLIFIISITFLFFLKQYYRYYMNNDFQSQHFLRNLTYITIGYLVAVIFRSLYFATANLAQAKRIGSDMIYTINYANIQFYEENGKENLTCRLTSDMESVDNQFPHEMNILFNNIFEMIFKLGVLVWSFFAMIVPVIIFMMDFYKKFFRYRRVSKYLEVNSNLTSERLLESVNAISNGKVLIKGMRQEQKYLEEFNNRLDQYINNKACIHTQDRQFSQRFHLMTQFLMFLALGFTYFYKDSIKSTDVQIKLAISAMIGVTDYFGWFSKSIVTNEKISYTLKRQKQCMQSVKHVNSHRMTDQIKKSIKEDKGIRELNIEGLVFKYNKSETNILDNLNVHINQNQKILIRGKTGSGKTTLFKVLTGLYPQFSSVSKYFQNVYISFSPQKPLILPGSLRQNLDPYSIFSDTQMEPFLNRFSSKNVQELTLTQKLLINTTRAQVYGRSSVSIYDQPHTIPQKGTLIIVSHHGQFIVNREYQLVNGRLELK